MGIITIVPSSQGCCAFRTVLGTCLPLYSGWLSHLLQANCKRLLQWSLGSLESRYPLASVIGHSQGPCGALMSVLDAWGGGFPHLRSGKDEGVGGMGGSGAGEGEGIARGMGLSHQCLPKKKGPEETPWLVPAAAFLGFSHNLSSSFPIHTVNCFGRARGYLENRKRGKCLKYSEQYGEIESQRRLV